MSRPVFVVGVVECRVITLGLHEVTFDFPLLPPLQGPLSVMLVGEHVTEVVEGKPIDPMFIASEPINLLGLQIMIEHVVVVSGNKLDSLSPHMSIELHENANQGQVIGWNVSSCLVVVDVPERVVGRRSQPVVVAVQGCEGLNFVRVAKLLDYLGDGAGGEVAVGLTYASNVNELLGVRALVGNAVVEHFVAVIQLLNL